MYTKEEVENAVASYHEIKHYQKTIEELGYPTLSVLWQWVHGHVPRSARDDNAGKPRKK